MRPEVLWDRSAAETRDDLRRAGTRGGRIVSIASYGDRDAVLHATVWAFDGAPVEQRLELDLAAARAGAVVARHVRDGFHAALLAMTGPVADPVLSIVLERVPPGAISPVFLEPRPFRSDRGELFVASATAGPAGDALLLRSVAAAGDGRRGRGEQLVVAGVLWPQPPTRVAWAVHLDDATDVAWRESDAVRTLETVARPVAALPVALDGARSVLSVWHDDVLEPWPTPDPLARARRFVVEEASSSDALAAAVARRHDEDRRVLALGASTVDGATSFIALLGAQGRDAPLPRRFVVGGVLPPTPPAATATETITATTVDADAEHPIDRWMRDHMRATGSRHGQIVVVRGRDLVVARACTLAEEGYPIARLDDALRLGSVSKMLTAIPLLAAATDGRIAGGVGARVVDEALLDLGPGEGPPRLASVTLRDLLAHDAGLHTSLHVRPDDPGHPLAEDRLAAALGRRRPLVPGELREALRAMRDDAVFARIPGGADPAALDYSNEGFVLLGEILARVLIGRYDGYEEAMCTMLRRIGIEPGERGCLLGAGRLVARARGEAPAHPSSPTWAPARFDRDGGEGARVVAPYADNGPFLGGAAGWCVPLLWVAGILSALTPRADGRSLWTRAAAELAATPVSPGSRHGHGVFVATPCWWSARPDAGGAPLAHRVLRLHHNGRLEGASALIVHQMPLDTVPDAASAALGIAVAFDRLGPLYFEPHGRQLLGIVQALEIAGPWAPLARFDCLPVG